jgi:hypothetical protein
LISYIYCKFFHTKTKIYPYGSGKSIDIIGTFDCEIKSDIHKTAANTSIYVVKGSCGSLLSYATAVDLNIIPTARSIWINFSFCVVELWLRFEF